MASPAPSRRALLGGLAGLSASLGGCASTVRYPYRYGLTVELEADGSRYVGRNVVQVARHVIPPPRGVEAVGDISDTVVTGGPNVIDFGQGRRLVALLTRMRAIDEPRPTDRWDVLTPEPVLARIYGVPRDDDRWTPRTGSPMLAAIAKARGAHEIGLDDLPTMMGHGFSGAGPDRWMEVDPHDLSPAFGPAVAIRRATLEVTDRWLTLRGLQRLSLSALGVAPTTERWPWG